MCIYPPSNQPETVPPESQHGADPEAHLPAASPTAAVLAVCGSFFQKSNDFAGARAVSLPMVCQASCSPWDRARAVMWLRPQPPFRKQLVVLSSAGCRVQSLPQAGKGRLWAFLMAHVLQSQNSPGLRPNRWALLGQGGGHLRKGNSSQHQTRVGLLSN